MAPQDSPQDTKPKIAPNTLDTDELLELLENQEDLQEQILPNLEADDVLNFITTLNIEPGETKVKAYSLYLIYKAWSKEPVNKGKFYNDMQKYFSSIEQKVTYYLINKNAIKLTHEAYKYFTNDNVRIKSKQWAEHFEYFLKFHSLTSGEFYVDYRILHFIYDKYCHATGLDRHPRTYLGKETFKIYCKLYLPKKLTKHGTLYGVSDNFQQFFQVGQLKRMQEEYEKKEKKPKKRGRKPSRK